MNFKNTIVPNGERFFMGSEDTIAECQSATSVRVAFPINVDFIVLQLDGQAFITAGPTDGSPIPHLCIGWAYHNAPGVGISIETHGGLNCPIIWLPNQELADQMLANLRAQTLTAM
jgi:hypothetical protein